MSTGTESKDQDPSAAPCYVPAAAGLVWWRRAFAQGLGYLLPSSAFMLVPFLFAERYTPLAWVGTIAAAVGVLCFFFGVTVVAHRGEAFRWTWVLGLMLCLAAMGIASNGDAKPLYFVPYVTAVIAMLIPWVQSRVAIVVLAVAVGGWSLYRADMFGLVMALVGATLGLGLGLSFDRERIRQALDLEEQRTAVLAVAAERARIGRDLHDILGHSLTTIAVKADLAARLAERDPAQSRAQIEEIAEIARQGLADVRATASGMREVRLASELASARSVLEAAGIECAIPSAVPPLSAQRSELLGYVVREGVTNVVRHSGASVCRITITDSGLEIGDDGKGFGPGVTGTGLRGLRERMAAAGGTLTVNSGAETTLTARFFEEE